MATAAELTKQAYVVLTYFLKKYEDRYKRKPMNWNRYRDKWGFQSMVEDVGVDRAKEIIDYYFDTNKPGHTAAFLFNNYDRINNRMIESEEDKVRRAQLMVESAERVKQWREKNGE